MASDPDDLIKAEKAQRDLRGQVTRCRTLVSGGRQLFLLAQSEPKITAANSN